MKIDWTSKLLSNYYTFFVNGQRMGRMDKNAFSTTSEVEWNGDRYQFTKRSVLSTTQHLLDADDNELLQMDYQFLNSKATIRYGDRIFTWKFTNIFGSRWILETNGILVAEGNSNVTSGRIDFQKEGQFPVFLIFSAFQSFYSYSVTIILFVILMLAIIT